MSAINWVGFGIRPNVQHFNWMSWRIRNCDPRTDFVSCLPFISPKTSLGIRCFQELVCGLLNLKSPYSDVVEPSCDRPVASLRSWKNFWLKMNATPLISSTFASAVVFLLMKLAVMAIASLPRNSLRRNPGENYKRMRKWRKKVRNQCAQSWTVTP